MKLTRLTNNIYHLTFEIFEPFVHDTPFARLFAAFLKLHLTYSWYIPPTPRSRCLSILRKVKMSPQTAVLCIISLQGGYAPAKLSQLSSDSVQHRRSAIDAGCHFRIRIPNSDRGRTHRGETRWTSNYPKLPMSRELTSQIRRSAYVMFREHANNTIRGGILKGRPTRVRRCV